MIRWKGLIAFAVIAGLILLFNFLFLDRIIRGIAEDQASFAVGARVDIGDLRTRLFSLGVEIRDLQVTNPEQPMQNAVQIGSMAFDLAAAPLLKKKVVIERMTVKDLAFDTPRKKSGALPRRIQKKLEVEGKAEAGKGIEDCVLPDFSNLADLKKRSAEELLAGVNLQSLGFVADYQKKVATAKATWEKRLAALPTKETIEKDVKALQSLKDQRSKDVTKLPAYLERVNALQQKLKETTKNLTDTQQEFRREIGNLKASLKEVEELKGQDLKTVMGRMGIQIPSSMDLICVLLGKDVAQKVNWTVAWYRKLGTFMPSGKPEGEEEKPVEKPRLKGVDVHFPVTHGYPDFLLELADFSVLPGEKKGEREILAFNRLTGQLRGLTTQPSLYNKPTTFRLEGALAGNVAKELTLSGEIDHRTELVTDRVSLNIKELNIERLGIQNKESLLQLASGILNINGYLGVQKEALKGQVSINVLNPKIVANEAAPILAELFKNMGSFDVTMTIGGTLDQPSLTLSSNAEKTLASGLENIVQTRLKGIQGDLKKIIASRVDKDFNTANVETIALEKFVQGDLSSRLSSVSLTPAAVPSKEKKGIFRLLK